MSLGIVVAATSVFGATVRGVVQDEAGRPVDGQSVWLSSDGFHSRTHLSDGGRFAFEGTPAGTYSLEIQADGFGRAKVEQIVLSNQGEVMLAPIVLQWEGIEQSGLIHVPMRRRALADVTEGAVAIRLAGEDGDLPMAGAQGELWLDHARVGVCLTDGDGFCRFTGLKGGSYWFRAKREGYFDQEILKLPVWRGFEIEYGVSMEPCSPGKCDAPFKRMRMRIELR